LLPPPSVSTLTGAISLPTRAGSPRRRPVLTFSSRCATIRRRPPTRPLFLPWGRPAGTRCVQCRSPDLRARGPRRWR